MKKSYYAVIPANVRYDKRLTANAKLIYGEITALCNEKGYCWARNSYFAELYNVSKKSVSIWINQLIEFGYIYSEIKYVEGTKEIENRYLKLTDTPISLGSEPMEENFHTPTEENFHTPMEENFQDNNTVINNTVINIKNKKEKNSKKEKNEINEQKQEYELLELKRVKETVIQKVENVLLQKKILNFLNFRIKNKKPVTIEYIRVFLEKLDKLSNFNDNEKIEILNQSIERGYTTIYAVNKNSNFNFNRYNKTISTPESYDTSEYEIITSSEDYLDNAMDLL